MAGSLTTRFSPRCFRVAATSSRRRRPIARSSSRPSGLKTMTSSIRLMNSGENSRRSSLRTISSTSRSRDRSFPSPKPISAPVTRNFVPMFEVMMMSVFLKSTTLP